MDGEFFTIIIVGLLFVFGAGGYVVWNRRRENAGDGNDTPAPKKSAPAPKPEKKAPEPEKEGLLSKLGVTKKSEPERKKGEAPSESEMKELEELILAGHIDDAARVAMRLQLWDKAAQLYLKAQQPGNAAHCAKRAGKFEMAAEFYEKAGEIQSAVRMWERSGNVQRARELAGDKQEDVADEDSSVIQISKELQSEIDAAIEKKDHMRAAELYEQAGDKENAAEQFAAFAQTARRPEVYAEKIQALSPRVAYNLLRTAQKGRKPDGKSAELYRRLAGLQHHFNNPDAAKKTLKRLLRAVPDDEEAQEMLDEIEAGPPSEDDRLDVSLDLDDEPVDDEPAEEEPSEPDEAEPDEAEPAKAKPAKAKPAKAKPAKAKLVDAEADEAVEAARTGPSIEELVGLIASQPCDLGNIEVYYRLGLACLASNKEEEALKAFRAVDGVSPGYRDTTARIDALE